MTRDFGDERAMAAAWKNFPFIDSDERAVGVVGQLLLKRNVEVLQLPSGNRPRWPENPGYLTYVELYLLIDGEIKQFRYNPTPFVGRYVPMTSANRLAIVIREARRSAGIDPHAWPPMTIAVKKLLLVKENAYGIRYPTANWEVSIELLEDEEAIKSLLPYRQRVIEHLANEGSRS